MELTDDVKTNNPGFDPVDWRACAGRRPGHWRRPGPAICHRPVAPVAVRSPTRTARWSSCCNPAICSKSSKYRVTMRSSPPRRHQRLGEARLPGNQPDVEPAVARRTSKEIPARAEIEKLNNSKVIIDQYEKDMDKLVEKIDETLEAEKPKLPPKRSPRLQQRGRGQTGWKSSASQRAGAPPLEVLLDTSQTVTGNSGPWSAASCW